MRQQTSGSPYGLSLRALALPASALAASTGDQFHGVSAPASIITGHHWSVTGTVVDGAAQPVANETIWVGIKERSVGCGDPTTSAACINLASQYPPTDADGAFSIDGRSDFDTDVVLYLADDQDQLDPMTGQQIVIHTRNHYVWSGPGSATLPKFEVGSAPFMRPPGAPHSKLDVASGRYAATPQTQISTDGGGHWHTVASGINAGVFPVTNLFGSDPISFFASKPGTYLVRVREAAGAFEDAAGSPVVRVRVKVISRRTPGWLARTNVFRHSLDLPSIAENRTFDAALAKHVHWMHINGILSHYESTNTPGYTQAGDVAGQSVDLANGYTQPKRTVDVWVGAPFHATCLFNPYWAVGGYAIESGWSGEWCRGSAQTLDLARARNAPNAGALRRSFTFPSPKMPVPTTLLANAGENPSPDAHCPGMVNSAWSVPVIFRVHQPPAGDRSLKHATAHLLADKYAGKWAVLLVGVELRGGHRYTATLRDGAFKQRTTFTTAKS